MKKINNIEMMIELDKLAIGLIKMADSVSYQLEIAEEEGHYEYYESDGNSDLMQLSKLGRKVDELRKRVLMTEFEDTCADDYFKCHND